LGKFKKSTSSGLERATSQLIAVRYRVPPMNWVMVNNELEGMWKEAVVAELKVLSRHRETEKNHEETSG
jgi:hypothetical protein